MEHKMRTFKQEYLYKIGRRFFSGAIIAGLGLLVANQAGLIADLETFDWQGIHTILVVVGTGAARGGWAAITGPLFKDIGNNPDSPDAAGTVKHLKAAIANGNGGQ